MEKFCLPAKWAASLTPAGIAPGRDRPGQQRQRAQQRIRDWPHFAGGGSGGQPQLWGSTEQREEGEKRGE